MIYTSDEMLFWFVFIREKTVIMLCVVSFLFYFAINFHWRYKQVLKWKCQKRWKQHVWKSRGKNNIQHIRHILMNEIKCNHKLVLDYLFIFFFHSIYDIGFIAETMFCLWIGKILNLVCWSRPTAIQINRKAWKRLILTSSR